MLTKFWVVYLTKIKKLWGYALGSLYLIMREVSYRLGDALKGKDVK